MASLLPDKKTRRLATGVTPPPWVSQAIRLLVAVEGESALARRIGVGRTTVARLSGRLTCKVATIEFVISKLGLSSGIDRGGGRLRGDQP